MPITGGGGGSSIGGIIVGGITNSVLFINPDGILAQDNAHFTWDSLNKFGLILFLDDQTTSPSLIANQIGITSLIQGGLNWDAGSFGNIIGLQFSIFTTTTNNYNATIISPVYGQSYPNLAAGSVITDHTGIVVDMTTETSGFGNVNTRTTGILVALSSGSAITDTLTGINISSGSFSSATVTTCIGIDFTSPFGYGVIGTGATTWYGIRIPAVSGPATVWGLFFSGTMDNAIAGRLKLGATTAPVAKLDIAAGTATAGTGPFKLTSGTVLTVAVAGMTEFTTNDLFFTITTGTARKRILMADPVGGLTSGRVPFATTNGRLTDDSDMTFVTDTLTITKIAAHQLTGNLTVADAINIVLNTTTGTQFGTGTTQKLAFHGSAAVVQRAGAAQVASATTAATNVAPFGYTTAAQADAIVTLLNEIRAVLVEKGLMKGAA